MTNPPPPFDKQTIVRRVKVSLSLFLSQNANVEYFQLNVLLIEFGLRELSSSPQQQAPRESITISKGGIKRF